MSGGSERRPEPAGRLSRAFLAALALALALPASASLGAERRLGKAAAADDDASSDEDGASDADATSTTPSVYIDLSTTLMRAPGNSFVIGRRGFFSITGGSSNSLSIDAPLTIDVTDALSLYAGIDFGSSKAISSPWTRLTLGNFNAGLDYTFTEQAGFIPELSVSGSVSRPLHVAPGSPLTTTWSGGLDADYAFDEDRTRGLLAGLALTYVAVNSGPGSVEPVYGGYVGAYRQWDNGWKLTGKAGYATFGGANIGSIIRATPVRQVLARLELEKYDSADNKLFGVALAGSLSRASTGKTGTSIQIVLSVPLYLTKKQ